jgi:hypothetical protein
VSELAIEQIEKLGGHALELELDHRLFTHPLLAPEQLGERALVVSFVRWEGLGLLVGEMRRRGWDWLVDVSERGAWCAFERGHVKDFTWEGYDQSAETADELPVAAGRAALLALTAEERRGSKSK